jgi:hypothetical protein
VWRADGTAVTCFGPDGAFGLADVTPTAIRPSFEVQGHPGGVTAAAWAHDGKGVYTAGMDKAVRLWAPPADDAVASDAAPDGITALAVHPDGKWVATGCADGTIDVRDPTTLKPKKTFAFADNKHVSVFGLAWSPDGRTLFAAGASGSVPVLGGAAAAFDPDTGEARWRTRGMFGSVAAIALSADGTRLAGACGDTFVRVWDAATGKELHCLKGHHDRAAGVTWSPDGTTLATCGLDHTVRLWDAAGTPLATLAGHFGPVLRLHFSPDGKTLASAGIDRVLLWKVEPGKD